MQAGRWIIERWSNRLLKQNNHEVRTSIPPPWGMCALRCGSPVATSAVGRSTDRGDSRDACPDRRGQGIFVTAFRQGCGSPVATSAAGRSTDRGDSRDANRLDVCQGGFSSQGSVQGVPCALTGYPNSLKPSAPAGGIFMFKEEI